MSETTSLRRLAAVDIATVAAVCTAACKHDPNGEQLVTELLRTRRHATVAVVHGSVVGVCITSTGAAVGAPDASNATSQSVGFVDLLAVDPVVQGQGIGTRLLTYAERRLADAGCDRVHLEGNAPFYAWPGVDVRYMRALALAESRGYRRLGVEMTMSVDLSAAPLTTADEEARLLESGVAVRPARNSERNRLLATLATGWKPAWLLELDAALATRGAGVIVAVHDKDYVGFCGFGANRPGEVGPLGTEPHWRGHGIGTVLIRRAMRALAEDGHGIGQLPWAGPVAMFARTLDAAVTRVFVRYGKQLR